MKRTRFWRGVIVAIVGVFLLTCAGCGLKGDPVPPQKPGAPPASEKR